jgi:hypothetical protein
VFRTPRLADFTTDAGLEKLTGYPKENWAQVILKEFTDNAAACPSARDSIALFRGLSGTAKQNAICKEIGVGERETLAAFHKRLPDAAFLLLMAMRERSRPVKPRDLGVIGRDHLRRRFSAYDNSDGAPVKTSSPTRTPSSNTTACPT